MAAVLIKSTTTEPPAHPVSLVTGVDLPFALTFVSASSILFSIAVSQITMGLALAALLLSSRRLKWPPLKAPILSVFATTVLALLLSASPVGGLPQIRKFYVFVILFLVVNTFRNLRQIQGLLVAWTAIACASASLGFAQYLARRHEAAIEGAFNYDFFLDDRVHGLAGHWMTFGGEQMIVAILVSAFVLFGAGRALRLGAAAAMLIIWVSVAIGLTRSVFLLGLPAGLTYLLWQRRRAAVLLLPAAATLTLAVAPFQVRERVLSVIHPHGDFDSNSRRVITFRTGWEMVKAHPWFGLGPEQIQPQFDRYVPADIPRPLPRGWYGHLHDIYLQYAAERGIPGLLAVLWLLLTPIKDFAHALRPGRNPRIAWFVWHGAIAVTLGIMAEGLFEHNLGDSEVLTMYLIVIGLGYVASNCMREAAECE